MVQWINRVMETRKGFGCQHRLRRKRRPGESGNKILGLGCGIGCCWVSLFAI